MIFNRFEEITVQRLILLTFIMLGYNKKKKNYHYQFHEG